MNTNRKAGQDTPVFFRMNIEVGSLDKAEAFYGELMAMKGRRQGGARVYFSCGPVTLQVVDVTAGSSHPVAAPHPAAKALYFIVKDLDAIHARAQALGCLSDEEVHGERGGDIVTRPWGERSFYAQDPWLNPLCFVQEGTTYPG